LIGLQPPPVPLKVLQETPPPKRGNKISKKVQKGICFMALEVMHTERLTIHEKATDQTNSQGGAKNKDVIR
jgi:hypothetical protein